MDADDIELLPSPLRERAIKAFQQQPPLSPLEATYYTVQLLQEVLLYLASLAVAEYRGQASMPALEAELAIASFTARKSLESYGRMLRACAQATGGASCLGPLLEAEFRHALKLEALLDVAESRARQIEDTVRERIATLEDSGAPSPDFDRYLKLTADFRNRAFAHTDWHGLDGADDFFPTAAYILLEVAEEVVMHPHVTSVWTTLRPASVSRATPGAGQIQYLIRLTDFQSNLEVAQHNGHLPTELPCPRYKVGERILLRNHDSAPTIVGEYRALRQGMRQLDLTIEPVIYELLAKPDPVAALAEVHRLVETGGGDRAIRRWLPDDLVDDVVVCVLRHFKFNGDTADEGIPERVLPLLPFTSDALPDRITRDAERFAAVTVRHPAAPPAGRGPRNLQRQAQQGPLDKRLRAIVRLGFKRDETSRRDLEKFASDPQERRRVRKQAILSIGTRRDRRSTPVLTRLAADHRRDPQLASSALIALAAVNNVDSVEFLVRYLQGSAPYACTDAAAWALALIAERHPEHVRPWRARLLRFVKRRDGDPYTRGTVLFCLGKLGDADLPAKVATLLCADEDPFVIEDACAALAALGSPSSVAPLIEVLEGKRAAFADLCVTREAIISLGQIGGPEARAALERYAGPRPRLIERVLTAALARLSEDDAKAA